MLMPLLLMTLLQTPMPTPPPEPAVGIAPKTYLIRATPMPGRGPDGNTIIIDAPDGLIVVDTGRHQSHSDAILNFARARKRPIATIVNTHWHLDHTSGNGRLKAAYPKARVYTTTAVDRVLAPGGFLARNLADATKMLESTTDPVRRDEIQIFIDTMAARGDLRPDVPVTRSQQTTWSAYPLDVRVTDKAVSDAGGRDWRPGDGAGAVLRNRLSRSLARLAGRSVGHAVRDRGARARPADDARPVRCLPACVRRVGQLRAFGQPAGTVRGRVGQRHRRAGRRRPHTPPRCERERGVLCRLPAQGRRQGARLPGAVTTVAAVRRRCPRSPATSLTVRDRESPCARP